MTVKSIHFWLYFRKINTSLGILVKRGFDILISIALITILAPFYGLIALAIRRDSPGPVLYRGMRMGRGGRPFQILKFRTMYEVPASYAGPSVTAQDDPRITELGRWLRDTKINELPQFWNVLKGDMSLVGPRPEDPAIAQTWSKDVWDEVLSVRPGITSPASIEYRNEESLLTFGNVLQKYLHELTPNKIRLDQLYVRYRSFWLDLDVLLWTALVILPIIRSYSPPETLIFVGPVSRLIRRYVRWFSIDLLVTFASIGFTGLVWRLFGPLDLGFFRATLSALGFALLFSLTGAVLGVNRIAWSKATYADIYDLVPTWLIATTSAIFACYIWQILPIGLVLIASTIAFGGFVIVRYRTRLITGALSRIIRSRMNAQRIRERVLIVGSGRTAEHIAWLLGHPAYAQSFKVVGFVDDDLITQGMRIYGSRIIGTCQQLPQLVKKNNVSLVILADHRMGDQGFHTIYCACQGMLTKVVVVPDIFGSLSDLFDNSSNCHREVHTESLADYRCEYCLARYSHRESISNKQLVEEDQ